MVPAMGYYLRCIAPTCIDLEARQFDQRMEEAAMDKLGLGDDERHEHTREQLQRQLKDGGWGLTAAVRTSPAAFVASLAVCHSEPAFSPYCGDQPLPYTSLLHGWTDDSVQRIRQAAPGDEYQSELKPLLPVTAGTLFSFYSTAQPSAPNSSTHSTRRPPHTLLRPPSSV